MSFRERRLLKKLSVGDDALKSAVAMDPNTPVGVLESLATDPSVAIRLSVAANPATSQAALYLLGHDIEWQVRQAALARLLEIAGFKSATSAAMQRDTSPRPLSVIAESLPRGSRVRGALCGTAPDWDAEAKGFPEPRADVLVELAQVRDPEVRAEVAKSAVATPAILEALALDPEDSVRLTVARNAKTPVDVLQSLLSDVSSNVRIAALSNEASPVNARAAAARDTEPKVRQRLAALTDTSVDVLRELTQDQEAAVRMAVAYNLDTPPELLAKLAEDPDAEVRLAVALGTGVTASGGRYPNYRRPAPDAVLVALSSDDDPRIRIASSGNPQLPIEALEVLANDPDPDVRGHVARVVEHGYDQPLPWDHRSHFALDGGPRLVPTELLARLATSAHFEIRNAVGLHPEVPASVLIGLPGNDPYRVLRRRSWSAEDWRLLASHPDPQFRGHVAHCDGVPDDVVDQLADDPDDYVRLCTLHNRTLPAVSLRRLMDDSTIEVAHEASVVFRQRSGRHHEDLGVFVDAPDPGVRAFVAQAESAQIEWLDRLAGDSDPSVRAAVAKNAATPPGVRLRLSGDTHSGVIDAIVDTVGKRWIPPEDLTHLSAAPNSRVRAAVAAVPHLPDEVLRSLICDPEESVRLAAAANGFRPMLALLLATVGDDGRGLGQEGVPRLAALAGDDKLDSVALHSLAQSPFEEVRAIVAANASTVPATLANLARDPKPSVRVVVAWSLGTPGEVLTSLARDDSVEVRRGVAANPQSPPDALVHLERDPDPEVALAVSRHPATPSSSLDALIEVHSEPQINSATARHLARLVPTNPLLDALLPGNSRVRDELLQSGFRWKQGVRQAVAANPRASSAVLSTLAQQPDTAAFAAANPSTPVDILVQLATSTDQLVLVAVADNPNTPEAQLGVLALSPEESVRIRVASNERTPVRSLEILAGDFSSRVANAAQATLAAADHS